VTGRDTGAANLRFARHLLAGLHAAGVGHVVLCPGSRSTPLALAAAEHPGLVHTVHLDERSAAFFALGHAKATGRAVAIACTSGTAAANFLPAVAEAHHARVPLVVLTADRPPELRAWGAAQTLDQRGLYLGFTRFAEDAPCPGERDGEDRYAAALARRAVVAATGPAPGPVHLNLPFREPLVPAEITPWTPPPHGDPTHADLAGGATDYAVGDRLKQFARGVLLFGPDAHDPALAEAASALALALGWPLLADPASGLRAGPSADRALVAGADLLLRDAATAEALAPGLVVRFGGHPTSASVNAWLARHAMAEVWLVDPADGFRDPLHRAGRTFRAGSRRFCEAALRATGHGHARPSAWLAAWKQADAIARAAAHGRLQAAAPFLGPQLAQALWQALPADATLYVANSMPVRELDAFAGPRAASLRVLVNRGVNGIDGLVSCALGAAVGLGKPTVLYCGDLAFLHDLGGLLAGRQLGAHLTVVVANDHGGGIFEYLPVARSVPRELFEQVWATPQAADLGALAAAAGWNATRAESAEAFADALAGALRGGLHVIEVPMDRAANTALHAALVAAVDEALAVERPA
jgi:2-succinyl-5-enolpyruvyl-6-hydroxy-3-cyclohexene-1-carboxylate synthase